MVSYAGAPATRTSSRPSWKPGRPWRLGSGRRSDVALIGQSVPRREDARLLTGRGRFTADVHRPGQLYAVMLRSPHAYARIRTVRVDQARRAPGVHAVYTGRDLVGRVGAIPTAWRPPGADLALTEHPALAVDTVRYVGDALAMVIADSVQAARRARNLI